MQNFIVFSRDKRVNCLFEIARELMFGKELRQRLAGVAKLVQIAFVEMIELLVKLLSAAVFVCGKLPEQHAESDGQPC